MGIEKRGGHRVRKVKWQIALRLGKICISGSLTRHTERLKAQVCAKVEHPFDTIKRMFGYDKVRYHGLAKNHNRLCCLSGLTNFFAERVAHALIGCIAL